MANTGMGTAWPTERLDGSNNYQSWNFSIRMLLMHENLWNITVTGKAEGVKAEEKSIMDQRALAKIGLSINKSLQPHIQNCKTAKEAYDILHKTYGATDLSSRISVLRQLCSVNLSSLSSMDEYISTILAHTQKLAEMKKPLDDEFIAALMLSGLTDDYQPLVIALEHSAVPLTSDAVKSKLLSESNRRTSSENSALLLRKSKNNQTQGVRCSICRRNNHTTEQHRDKPLKNRKFQKSKNQYDAKKTTDISLFTTMAANVTSTNFIIDSGSNVHVCSQKDFFTDLNTKSEAGIKMANGDFAKCFGRGQVRQKLGDRSLSISDTYYSPDLATNLISVSKMVKKGFSVLFDNRGCKIRTADGELLLTVPEKDGLYILEQPEFECASNENAQSYANAVKNKGKVKKLSQYLWHSRLGHLNSKHMECLRDGEFTTGIDFESSDLSECVTCVEGKHRRLPVPQRSDSRASKILELVHTDIAVVNVVSNGGAKYAIIFVDDYSRKTFIYPMHRKADTFAKFKEFHVFVEKQTDQKLKCIRSDNGTEYFSNNFKSYLKQHGIRHESSIKYTPEQNGVAESTNKAIFQRVRCMLLASKLPKSFWAEAAATSVYVKNRSPTTALKMATPEGTWTGKPVNLSNLRVFGCTAYERIDGHHHKLESRSKKYIFVGYSETQKGGYRLTTLENPRAVHIGRNVIFHEDVFCDSEINNLEYNAVPNIHDSPMKPIKHPLQSGDPIEEEASQTLPFPEVDNDVTFEPSELNSSDTILNDSDPDQISPPMTRSRGRMNIDPEPTEDQLITFAISAVEEDEPSTAAEALARPDGKLWRKAMLEELSAMQKNSVYTIVDKPANAKVVGSRWVFKIKRNTDGTIERYKARLVARGFSQTVETETYSPVMRYVTLRLLLALAVQNGLQITHCDVQSAYLHGELEEAVYMLQPDGFTNGTTQVCKLKKAIYGLKNAGRAWYEKLSQTLYNIGFERCKVDSCVFRYGTGADRIILGIWVDDILILSNNSSMTSEIISKLTAKFDIRNLGEPRHFLGLNIVRQNNTIKINQTHYINSILRKFKMETCSIQKTPMDLNTTFTPGLPVADVPYRELIGSLLWLSTCTRPDITFATNRLASYTNCATAEHWSAAKRVLRYLQGTKNYNLTYEKSKTKDIIGFSDSDWAGDKENRRSTTGFTFVLSNGPIAWESRRQKTTALSTCEAEYMALSDASKEALFLRNLYSSIFKEDPTITLYEDNQSTMKLAANPILTHRTKHIDTRHHFVRECVDTGVYILKYVPTKEMVADILTKPLSAKTHQYFVSRLRLE